MPVPRAQRFLPLACLVVRVVLAAAAGAVATAVGLVTVVLVVWLVQSLACQCQGPAPQALCCPLERRDAQWLPWAVVLRRATEAVAAAAVFVRPRLLAGLLPPALLPAPTGLSVAVFVGGLSPLRVVPFPQSALPVRPRTTRSVLLLLQVVTAAQGEPGALPASRAPSRCVRLCPHPRVALQLQLAVIVPVIAPLVLARHGQRRIS